jgi:hypothetical protein
VLYQLSHAPKTAADTPMSMLAQGRTDPNEEVYGARRATSKNLEGDNSSRQSRQFQYRCGVDGRRHGQRHEERHEERHGQRRGDPEGEWQVQEAKQRFSELIRRASTDGPLS